MAGLGSGAGRTEWWTVLVPDDGKGKADLEEWERFLQADLSLPCFRTRGCSVGANSHVLSCINLQCLDFEGK